LFDGTAPGTDVFVLFGFLLTKKMVGSKMKDLARLLGMTRQMRLDTGFGGLLGIDRAAVGPLGREGSAVEAPQQPRFEAASGDALDLWYGFQCNDAPHLPGLPSSAANKFDTPPNR
jgi:hypothetical protein